MKSEHHLLADIIKLGFESLKGIFDDISNGITITDENSTILYVNPGFTNITGYTREEVIGQNPGMLHSGMQDKAFFEHMWDSIAEKGRWSGEIWNRHKEGHLIPEFLTITKIKSDQQVFYIAVFSDISILVEVNKKKLNLALTDALTRLPNRGFLEESFQYIVSQYRRDEHVSNVPSYQVVFLFIDVNEFKAVNDTYGHLAGDAVLKHIAATIKQTLRGTDIAIRYGGDEFVVLLNKIESKKVVEKLCARIHEKLAKPLQYEGHTFHPKISIGAVFYPSQEDSLAELIKRADKAMYQAKQAQCNIMFAK